MRVTGHGDESLREAWVYFTPDEARDVLHSLQTWANGAEGGDNPGWNMHISDPNGEFSLSIEGTVYFVRPSQ